MRLDSQTIQCPGWLVAPLRLDEIGDIRSHHEGPNPHLQLMLERPVRRRWWPWPVRRLRLPLEELDQSPVDLSTRILMDWAQARNELETKR